jgi:hypothetical protein
MKKLFLVFAIAAAVALPASPTFSQQKEKPPAKEGQGMMGGMGGDPKMMGRTLEMRGEMMMKMGEVMMKHGKLMQKGDTK